MIRSEQIAKNISEMYYTPEEIISKNIEVDLILKGKRAVVGEIREFGGKKYQKQSDKTWKPVKEGEEKETGRVDMDEELPNNSENNIASKKLIEKFNELQRDRESWQKRALSYPSFLNKKDPSYSMKKRSRDEAYRKVESLDKKIDKIIYGESQVKSILNELEIPASKSFSTAIRGFNRFSNGFDLSNLNYGQIDVIGFSGTFNKIKEKLKERGFEISSEKEPSKILAGGSIMSFTVKPYYKNLSEE